MCTHTCLHTHTVDGHKHFKNVVTNLILKLIKSFVSQEQIEALKPLSHA